MATYHTLPESGLRYSDPGYPDWNTNVHTYNLQRLNDNLLKLASLLDVDITGLNDGDILSYSTATSKWEPVAGPSDGRWLSTTTTTTTSTTTTTTA